MSARRVRLRRRLPGRSWHRVVLGAEHEARSAGHRRLGSEHLLAALVSVGDGAAVGWLRQEGLQPAAVRARIREELDRRGGDPHGLDPSDLQRLGLTPPAGSAAPLPAVRRRRRQRFWSPDAVAVVHAAYEHARRDGRRALTPDDLAVGILDTRGCRARQTLVRMGVDVDRLRASLRGDPPPPAALR